MQLLFFSLNGEPKILEPSSHKSYKCSKFVRRKANENVIVRTAFTVRSAQYHLKIKRAKKTRTKTRKRVRVIRI